MGARRETDPLGCVFWAHDTRNVMTTFIARLRSLVRDVDGQDLIEYALLASLVAIFSIAGLLDAGTEVDTLWNNIATGIANAVP